MVDSSLEFLILASDGLWDVVTNEVPTNITIYFSFNAFGLSITLIWCNVFSRKLLPWSSLFRTPRKQQTSFSRKLPEGEAPITSQLSSSDSYMERPVIHQEKRKRPPMTKTPSCSCRDHIMDMFFWLLYCIWCSMCLRFYSARNWLLRTVILMLLMLLAGLDGNASNRAGVVAVWSFFLPIKLCNVAVRAVHSWNHARVFPGSKCV